MVRLEIVPTDIPALLGLDVLDSQQLTIGKAYNTLEKQILLVEDGGSIVWI